MPTEDNEIGDLGEIIRRLGDELTNPERPFTGQPYTYSGERGKTEVKGILFRDLADCIVCAFVDAAAFSIEDEEKRDEMYRRADDGTLNWNDVYDLDFSDVDPIAIVQNACCRVEKAMGIFPNIPGLTELDDAN